MTAEIVQLNSQMKIIRISWEIVVMDSYSKWPEVFLFTKTDADFTNQALRNLFSHEGIPQTLVTDNGTHFTAKSL